MKIVIGGTPDEIMSFLSMVMDGAMKAEREEVELKKYVLQNRAKKLQDILKPT